MSVNTYLIKRTSTKQLYMFTVIVFEWLLVEKAWRYSCTMFCFSAVALMKYVAPKHGNVDTDEDPCVLDRKQYTRLD